MFTTIKKILPQGLKDQALWLIKKQDFKVLSLPSDTRLLYDLHNEQPLA
jgi:hypothetical protein